MNGRERLAGLFGGAVAACILADPQHYVGALVEAGVLERREKTWCPTNNQAVARPMGDGCQHAATHVDMFTVVQPHKHEWCVDRGYVAANMDTLFLRCRGCPEDREVPNRLPIEVPHA